MPGWGRKSEAGKLLRRSLGMLCCLVLIAPGWSEGQSGRQKSSAPAGAPNTRRPKPAAPTAKAPSQSDAIQQPTPTAPASKTGAATDNGEDDPADVVRISSILVPITASVSDTQGRAITDLQPQDFELLVDGQPKPISDLSRSETPVRMAVLFDNSSSLTEARKFEKKAAIRFFRRVLRPVDQAAIYSVATAPLLEQPFTGDVPTLVRTIENFSKPRGATALFDAIAQASKYLHPQPGRKVIVLVSDGADTISHIDFNKSLQLVQATNCQVYAVQTGHSDNANLRDLAAERRLEEYARQTGGAVYTPKNTAELDAAFTQIAADLAQQYILSYYPTDDPLDGRFRKITLRVQHRPHARIRARQGYYARKG